MFQHQPPLSALENELRSLVGREGDKVAKICRLIHTESGLLSGSPVCRDRDHVLTMARTIVSSHQCEVSEVQCNRGFDEKMYQGLIQNEGERIAAIARQIYNACALSSNVNWDLLVDNARWIISPYSGEESEAQANMVIGFPGVRFKDD